MSESLPELLDAKALQAELAESTTVYVARNRAGVVLYVGITGQRLHRLHAHAKSSAWWHAAMNIELRHVDNREEAIELERELIQQLLPTHNVVHNSRRFAPLELVSGHEFLDAAGIARELGVSRGVAGHIFSRVRRERRGRRLYARRGDVLSYLDRNTHPPKPAA